MKTLSFLLGAAVALSLTVSAMAAEKSGGTKTGKVRHVVCFKFKETATKEQIQKIEDAFRDLKNKIPQIASFEMGTNNSPEGLNKGLTHCFILTFKNTQDRDAYLPHPAHKEFGKLLGPYMADVLVIDFNSQE